jgi:hypothetical protein
MPQDTIHEAVRNHYGAIARSVGEQNATSCCGPSASSCDSAAESECGGAQFYNAELLEGLPVDVTGLSMGCGGTQFA